MPMSAEEKGVFNGFRSVGTGFEESDAEGTPFELQPIAGLHLIEVIEIWAGQGQADIVLDTVPGFVHHQHAARMVVVRQWPHNDNPVHPGPFAGVVGDEDAHRQLAVTNTSLPSGFQVSFSVGLVCNNVSCLWIGKEHRAIHSFTP